MAQRKPIVQVGGVWFEMPAGDTLDPAVIPAAAVVLVDSLPRHLRLLALNTGNISGLSSSLVYWLWMGQFKSAASVARALMYVTAAATGVQTATTTQIVLATSPLPPNGTAQTLTCVAVSSDLTAFSSAGAKTTANASPWYAAAAGANLWVGFHHGMTTSGTISAINYDYGLGTMLNTSGVAAATVLVVGNTYSTVLTTNTPFPDIALLLV